MDSIDLLNLNKMIDANNVEDCTNQIRDKKHSSLIREDVDRLISLKKKYSRLCKTNPIEFDAMCVSQCSFLFNNYMDIFNKIKKDELNMDILNNLLNILKRIEDGVLDQHNAAFQVGKLLKEMYIDSALTKADRIDKITGKKVKASSRPKEKKITWHEFKSKNLLPEV
jgi:hypothetical protein